MKAKLLQRTAAKNSGHKAHSEGMVAYHATPKSNIEAIFITGIKPGIDGYIHATTTREQALRHGFLKGERECALIVIDVTKTKLREQGMGFLTTPISQESGVPPAAIIGAEVYGLDSNNSPVVQAVLPHSPR